MTNGGKSHGSYGHATDEIRKSDKSQAFPRFGAWKLACVFFFPEDFRGAQAGVHHFQRFVLKGSIKLNINCHLIKKMKCL